MKIVSINIVETLISLQYDNKIAHLCTKAEIGKVVSFNIHVLSSFGGLNLVAFTPGKPLKDKEYPEALEYLSCIDTKSCSKEERF